MTQPTAVYLTSVLISYLIGWVILTPTYFLLITKAYPQLSFLKTLTPRILAPPHRYTHLGSSNTSLPFFNRVEIPHWFSVERVARFTEDLHFHKLSFQARHKFAISALLLHSKRLLSWDDLNCVTAIKLGFRFNSTNNTQLLVDFVETSFTSYTVPPNFQTDNTAFAQLDHSIGPLMITRRRAQGMIENLIGEQVRVNDLIGLDTWIRRKKVIVYLFMSEFMNVGLTPVRCFHPTLQEIRAKEMGLSHMG